MTRGPVPATPGPVTPLPATPVPATAIPARPPAGAASGPRERDP